VSTVEHAKREFLALGYTPLDQEQEDDPNKWMQENVLELLEAFSKQGHSGSSAPYCINMFKKLASFEPLSPISCKDFEWTEVSDNTFQNKRLSSVFKNGVDGNPYYLYAITWRNQHGQTYTGSAFDKLGKSIKSSQSIKIPFTPKTFYVDVIEKEVAKDDWEFYIKDESQLSAVFEYYKNN
jgi:hypothetical protein